MRSAEKTRARLLVRIVALEATQDVLGFAAGVAFQTGALFQNLAATAKIVEVDAAKQYRDLTGTAVREIDAALLGPAAPPEAG